MKINPLIVQSRRGALFFAGLLSIIPASAADVTSQWNVKPVAVMVVTPEGGKDNRNFCWKPGVTVSAIFTPPHGKIISIDQNESKVLSFTDDKGTDLMAAPASDDPFNKPGLSYMTPQSGGGLLSAIVDLKASGLPAKGATSVTISGQVVAETAGDPKQVTVPDAEIKPGTTLGIGAMSVKIGSVRMETNSWDKKVIFSVTFNCPQSLDFISKIQFFDPQGNEVDAHKSSWGGGDFLGYMAEYELKQKMDHAKVIVSYWTDLKNVTVPFTIKTGVGL
jgi:hypothetical protein